MKIFKPAMNAENKAGEICIIVRRPYMHLKEDFEKTFEGQKDVKVVVDMRNEERRRSSNPVPRDRRQGERRKPMQELVEAVISI